MLRKFILTSLLVVIYNGSAPHLVASLITTFIFIIVHLKVLYAVSPFHSMCSCIFVFI
jgi:hypothetical protein